MRYATCEVCEKEMVPGGGCDYLFVIDAATGKWKRRIPMEFDDINCHDCNAGPGETHHLHCDWEQCPVCGGQMLGCPDIASETGFIEMAKAVKE